MKQQNYFYKFVKLAQRNFLDFSREFSLTIKNIRQELLVGYFFINYLLNHLALETVHSP